MRVYRIALELVASVMKLSRKVQRHDPDLARQMKRSVTSVPLNMQEGLYSRGGNRTVRFHDAMGSAKETMAQLDVSVAAEFTAKLRRDFGFETDMKHFAIFGRCRDCAARGTTGKTSSTGS